jgi:ABC-type transport system involved in multi-copper enzyme maturation permease subunit
MPGVFTVARFSFAEMVKSKVFKTIMIIGLIVNFLVCFMGFWTVSRSPLSDDIIGDQRHEVTRIEGMPTDSALITDQMTLAYITTFLRWFAYAIYIFFGNLLAIFVAIGLLAPELERRSIYTLISKPLSRSGIIFGKLLGAAMCQIVYAVIMILAAQFFFLISGAEFQKLLFPAFAVGFLNFLIFSALAMFLSIHLRSIPSAVISMIVLWVSTHSGVFFIETIGKELFKFGAWLDYALLILPQQKNIGFYALSFVFDKYHRALLNQMPDMFELVSDDPGMLIQPAIWLACIIMLNFLSFYRKEFD